MPAELISTGIQGLDSLLDGGLISGRSYLISGSAGTGKSISCLQFLKKGLEEGERAIYVTVNDRASHVLDAASSLGWDFQPYIANNFLRVLDASNYYLFNRVLRGKGAYFEQFIAEIEAQANLIKPTRLVIDPVSPLLSAHFTDMTTEECIHFLIDLLASRLPTTNFLTTYSSQTNDDDITSNIEEYFAAGVLVLRMFQQNKHFVRSLFVKKMRENSVQPNEYQFQILPGEGIVLRRRSPRSKNGRKNAAKDHKGLF